MALFFELVHAVHQLWVGFKNWWMLKKELQRMKKEEDAKRELDKKKGILKNGVGEKGKDSQEIEADEDSTSSEDGEDEGLNGIL